MTTQQKLLDCQQAIGYTFKNPDWLQLALTHSSNRSSAGHCNERLEFLGDAILGGMISNHIFWLYRDHAEGQLTRIKSIVVSRKVLAAQSKALGLDKYASIGKGLAETKGLSTAVHANLFEAVVGAIWIDGGPEPTRSFVLGNLTEEILSAARGTHHPNYKSMLQDSVLKERLGGSPTYRLVEQLGPDHDKRFVVVAVISGKEYAVGEGRTKKDAEQDAAKATYLSLKHQFKWKDE